MLTVLRQRNFALLFFGGLISLMGNWVLSTALPFYVYERSGSTLATALMVAAEIVPQFVLGSIAGVFVDRWDRKKIMVFTSIGQGLILLPMLLVASGLDLWIIYLVTLVQTTLALFFSPAENALLPRLVDKEHLVSANALNAMNNNIARLIGPPIGGLILAGWSLSGVVLFDSLTFVIAGLMILMIRPAGGTTAAPRPANAPAEASPAASLTSWQLFWHEWLEGLKIIRADRLVAWMIITVVLLNFAGTMLDPLRAPFVVNVVKIDAQVYGLVIATQAVGGILGGLLAGKIGQRISLGLVYGWSEVLLGALLFIRFNVPLLPVLFVTTFLLGLPAAAGMAALDTMFQQSVPNSHLGRILGTLNTTMAIVSLFGVLGIAGALGDVLGVVPVLNISAGVTLLTGFIILHFLASRRSPVAPVLAPEQDEI